MGEQQLSRWRAPKRISIAGTACVLAIGFPVSAGPASAAEPAAQRAGAMSLPRVFIVGDSLTVASKNQLRAKLRGRVLSLGIDARVGRHTREGISRLRGAAAKRAGLWVVALGTNDAASASQTRKNVATVMRLAGPTRQVIWINVVRPGPYHRVNRAFRNLDTAHHTLTVVDWAAIVRGRSGLLAGDRVHLTARGNRVRTLVTCNAIAAVSNPQRVIRS